MNNDQVSSGIWFFIGLTICLASLQYKFGTLSSPGSGFMPFLSGLAIALFSIIGFLHGAIRKHRGERWDSLLQGLHWEKAAIIIVSLFAYGLLLKPVGFLLCTLLFLGFLLRVIVPQRWIWVTGGSLIITLASYLVFEVFLKAQLPKGPLGF